MPADLSEQQRQDAERYFARWGDHARAYGWTAAQQDRLIRQIEGREVKQLTDTQALVAIKSSIGPSSVCEINTREEKNDEQICKTSNQDRQATHVTRC